MTLSELDVETAKSLMGSVGRKKNQKIDIYCSLKKQKSG